MQQREGCMCPAGVRKDEEPFQEKKNVETGNVWGLTKALRVGSDNESN